MNAGQQPASALTREEISAALGALSEKLGKLGVQGEICLFGATEVLALVGQYYPASRIPVKTQYLVEGLFEEGRI
jgi:hypothetical protein